MVSLTKFKYKVIKNLLNENELNLIKEYCINKHKTNLDFFDLVQNNCGDTFFYKDPLMEVILKNKKKILEKETNIKLLETYSFWRCYTFGAELTKHKDRPSCEISVTVSLGSDKEDWPIFMGEDKLILKPGDGVIYNGCEVEHWREPYDGDYHMQVFLHYVDKDGPYAKFKGDRHEHNTE